MSDSTPTLVTVLFVLIRIIAEMYAVFGVLFFLVTLPNPFRSGGRNV